MIKLQRVLVPTDFSECSQLAVTYGCELAQRFGAELHLLHVVQDAFPLVPEAGMLTVSHVEYMAQLIESSKQELDRLPIPQTFQGRVSARTVEVGAPFVEIIRYAREQVIDLIVIGTHGRTGLVHMLMGSVAEKVVRKAPCPVLTVRPDEHEFVSP